MFWRVIGFFMLLIGLLGIFLAGIGLSVAHGLVDAAGVQAVAALVRADEELTVAEDTLHLLQASLTDVNQLLGSVEKTTADVGKTVADTQPLLANAAEIAGEDAPNSLESLQEALPTLTAVAGVVDDTLLTLSNFRIDQEILGLPLRFDLGIRYQPVVTMAESVERVGVGLVGVPEQLEAVALQIELTNGQLQTVSDSLGQMASEMDGINTQIASFSPLIDTYLDLLTQSRGQLQAIPAVIEMRLEQVKWAMTAVAVWFGVNQLLLIYLGWELTVIRLRRRR